MRLLPTLRQRIVAGGSFIILAFAASAGYDGWRLHQQIEHANERGLRNLSRSLAEGALHTVQPVDLLLKETVVWYEAEGKRLDQEPLTAALRLRVTGVPQVSAITVLDVNGRQIFQTRRNGVPPGDVFSRDCFEEHRDNPAAGLLINVPVFSLDSGRPVPSMVVSRRLNNERGEFDGMLAMTVGVGGIEDEFRVIDPGVSSALVLTLEDGTLIVRQPPALNLPPNTKFPKLAKLDGGSFLGYAIGPVDNRKKLIAAVAVGKLPLTLAIVRDEEQMMSPWRDEMRSAVIRTILLTGLVLLTIAELLRHLRRREKIETDLRTSEERYAMAMEAANEGHGEWNLQLDTLFLSEKWRALHGIRPEEEILQLDDLSKRVLVHPDDVVLVSESLHTHIVGGSAAIEIEYRTRHGDGPWQWVHMRGRRVVDGSGRAIRFFFSAIDVSERKVVESERAALEAKQQQTNRLEALGTLAGGIAHDFNNILAALLGFGEMAQQEASSGSPIKLYVDRVMQAGDRARLLVRRILDFSRSSVAERVPVNIEGVLSEVLAAVASSLSEGIRLDSRLATGNAAVAGDATRLFQVAMNLCTNAVQAVGHSGTVVVTLERVRLEGARSFLHGEIQPGDFVRLEVSDTGSGLTPEVRARMFDPFFSTKTAGTGTGLGLSVVHGIVIDLGGAIDVEARTQGGTSVTVWLPMSGEVEPQAHVTSKAWPTGHGEVVMIVDDESTLVELLENLLAGLGYEPVGFASAELALKAFETTPDRFDLIIADDRLPAMSGGDLVKQMLAARPELITLLMSGNLSDLSQIEAKRAGVAAILHKPLVLRDLAICLSHLLAKRRPSTQHQDDTVTLEQ